MANKKLQIDMEDLINAMDQPQDFDETLLFLDTETGEVLSVLRENMPDEYQWGDDDLEGEDEDIEDLAESTSPRNEPDWVVTERELGRRIQEGGERYVGIEPFDSHEAYRFMQDFIGTVDDAKLRERLHRAISGRGAFRYFKDTLADHKMLDAWYAYEHDRKLEYAREWLESIHIEPA